MADTDEKLASENSKSLFRDINADDETPEVMEIESLCFKCEKNVCFRKIRQIYINYVPSICKFLIFPYVSMVRMTCK